MFKYIGIKHYIGLTLNQKRKKESFVTPTTWVIQLNNADFLLLFIIKIAKDILLRKKLYNNLHVYFEKAYLVNL